MLLRGVNDDPETLGALMRAFVEARIKPYYLHHADLAPGTAHLRTAHRRGQALMRDLRGRLSGLCQPAYVLDIPGGAGKSPVGPCYLRGRATAAIASRILMARCTAIRIGRGRMTRQRVSCSQLRERLIGRRLARIAQLRANGRVGRRRIRRQVDEAVELCRH